MVHVHLDESRGGDASERIHLRRQLAQRTEQLRCTGIRFEYGSVYHDDRPAGKERRQFGISGQVQWGFRHLYPEPTVGSRSRWRITPGIPR
jgi:hypothetical protein